MTNSLYMESPSGVGFSYCDKSAGCRHTDTSTAQDNLQALLSWFAAFPALGGRKFWISGESYAGIYIPTLADAIITYNKANPGSPINLQGIMVGNGCIGRGAGTCGNDGLNDYHDIITWRGHGLVTEPLYDAILSNCTWGNENAQCNNLLNQAANGLGDIDVYYLCVRRAAPRGVRARRCCCGVGIARRCRHARSAPGPSFTRVSPSPAGTTRAPTRPSPCARRARPSRWSAAPWPRRRRAPPKRG